jgi:hypothetical protein
MWHGIMWWWIIPLVCFLAMRGHSRRWHRRAGREGEHEYVAELRRVVEDQRGYIEELEARLSRVEEGLEFAERLLAERGAASSIAG